MFMEQNQTSFKDKLLFGQEGEHEVADFLLGKGISVLPLYQFNNTHAPFIMNKSDKVVSPDLICFSQKAFMVEVKTKNQWVSFKGRNETGIDLRLYRHYKKIKDFSNLEVYVFFNHKKKKPCGFYYCELDDYTRIWDGVSNGVKKFDEMVFYNRSVLKKINK